MQKNIGFIGGGNIAEAIIYGLTSGKNDFKVHVTNRSNKERLQNLAEKYSVLPSSLEELVTSSDILILAVKPKDVVGVLQSISGFNLDGKLVISVAAGIKLSTLEKYLPGLAVVRVMPNTSSAALHSMTGLVRGQKVTDQQVQLAEEIFSGVGKTIWISEDKMNALTAVSGSGPAYFYLFTEFLIKAGIQLGLSQEESEVLARETMIGAGKMLAQSGKSAARLREEVTSPNGTTFAALKTFTGLGLEDIVAQAAKACKKRAEEMEGEYSV